MDTVSSAWELLVLSLSQFRAFKVPILGVYLFELTNTLLGAQLLRQQLNYRVHWLRAFVLTVVAGVGGNSAASFFTGKTPRWINDPASFCAIVIGYWAVFHCPGDAINRAYTHPALRPLWDSIRGITIATSIANAVENAQRARWTNDNGPSCLHTCLIAGTIAAWGGGMISEFLNLMLLPYAQLKRPISGGPPFAAYAAIVCSGIYVMLLRDPTGSTAAFLRALGLPPLLPLGGDFAHSLTLLCFLTVPLQNRNLVPQPAFARRISEALAHWVPGFRPVFVPSEIGATGSTRGPGVLHADAFGYERHEEDDDPALALAVLTSAREAAAANVPAPKEMRRGFDAGVQVGMAAATAGRAARAGSDDDKEA